MEKVYALEEANEKEALFKYLVIARCNDLGRMLPGMFQRIAVYTEHLFPDDLLRSGCVIEQMVMTIQEDDWKDAVQIILWLYQYYNAGPKDEVFAALKKNIKISREKESCRHPAVHAGLDCPPHGGLQPGRPVGGRPSG